MKKLIIASLMAAAIGTASAYEIGVTAGRDGTAGVNTAGVTVGQRWDKVTATLGYERVNYIDNEQNRWSLTGGYDVVKLGQLTVSALAGVSYLDNRVGENGYALRAGVGASYPVTKNVALTAAAFRQFGQDRVSMYDGNNVQVGLKYSF
jgi:hypothetical protein